MEPVTADPFARIRIRSRKRGAGIRTPGLKYSHAKWARGSLEPAHHCHIPSWLYGMNYPDPKM